MDIFFTPTSFGTLAVNHYPAPNSPLFKGDKMELLCRHIPSFSIRTILLIIVWSFTSILTSASGSNRDTALFIDLLLSVDTVHLKVNSEGYELDTKLYKPKYSTDKLSVIIFLVGSGDGSTMSNYQSFTQFYFNDTLLESGYALVYFDKRGIGASEGVWYETTFEQRALDARNVALEVSKLEYVQSDQIFVVGHSQGGWIVQLALSLYPEVFAGGISMAGPTFSVRRQIVNDYWSGFKCKGLSEDKALRKARRKVNRELFLISLIARKGNLKQLKIIKDFEPTRYLKALDKPLLLMFAEHDPLVSPEWSLDALEVIFGASIPSNIAFYIAAGQQHSFKIAPLCYKGSSKDIKYSEPTRDFLLNWLKDNQQK